MADTENTVVETETTASVTDDAKRIADLEAQITALKNASSKNASEAAKYRRALQEKQSEDEKAEMERKEREEAKDALIATLQRRETLSNYTSGLLGSGFDAETAVKAAELLADGKMTEFFALQKSHIDNLSAQIKAESLNHQPQPSVGSSVRTSNEDAEQALVNSWFGIK